jgi:hypothetical protein
MRYLARLAAVALFLTALPLAAQTGTWTAVASAGAVDDSSLSAYATSSVEFQHKPGAVGTIFARYSVTNTFGGGMTDTPPWNTLDLGYYDNSSQGYVTALLFQVDPCTGIATLLCGKTSADTGPGCVSCSFTQQIDFSRYNYVVEVQVSRSSVNANPAARTLRLH